MKTAPFEKRKKNHPNWSWCCGCAVNTHTDTHAHAHGFYLFSFSLYYFINRLDSDTSGFCRVSLTLFSISNNINFIIYSVLSVGSLKSVRFIMMTMAIFFFFVVSLKEISLEFFSHGAVRYPNYVGYNPLLYQSMSIVSGVRVVSEMEHKKTKKKLIFSTICGRYLFVFV